MCRKQGDSMTRIHMNLHASVLLLNVAFLLSPLPATPPVPGSACTAVAAILHFALLSCLTWTAIEGFNLYLLLGRVYNIYIRRYLLKLCAVGWGKQSLPPILLPEASGWTVDRVSTPLLPFSSPLPHHSYRIVSTAHPCQHSPPLSALLFLSSILLPTSP